MSKSNIPIVELHDLKRTCMNIISVCDIVEDNISVERIPLVRRLLAEYAGDFDKRYLKLIDELEKQQTNTQNGSTKT